MAMARSMSGSTALAGLLTTLLIGVASSASAQDANAAPSPDFQHTTTLSGYIGTARASNTMDLAAGAAMGWQVTPHFGAEMRGFWLKADEHQNAFSAVVAFRASLRPGHRAVPFVAAGGGVYQMRFDTGFVDAPEFYRQRMTNLSPVLPHYRFTDPVIALGGGADLFVSRHVAIRPEAMALIVIGGGDHRTVPAYGLQVAYHFESDQRIH